MKIAIIRKKYTFHGGAESFSRELIKHLADEGHEVHVFSTEWDDSTVRGNISFHRVRTLPFTSFLRDLGFAFFACSALKGGKFDVVQSHDKTLCQDIYRAGDGCHIEWLRQRWRRMGLFGRLSIIFNPYHWLVLALERAILNGHRYGKILAISEFVRRNILENYNVHEGDIEVIHNGVDLRKFHPDNKALYRASIRERHSIAGDEPVALFVGSGFERKGVRFLLEALNLMEKPLTALIVGKGHELPFNDMHRNKRVVFCGPRKDIRAYYAAADMFVFPTIYEPFGNVHLEAMASGLPVITTSLSGASEIIEDGKDGFVVPAPEDKVKIARAITTLLDKSRRDEMSANARKKAGEFTFRRHIDETMDMYNRLHGDG
jgi:UDP-glucose:(heptosyl)LPS alpha-1,3-glucosyltransferase